MSRSPDYHVNGALTLGENIGDNSGLAIAYKAYRISLAGHEAPVIDGLTGDQRLYLGWVQVWRGKVREAEAIQRIKTDPHSPPGGARYGAAAKSARILCGVRLKARRQDVFAAQPAREYLVSVNLSAVLALGSRWRGLA